MKKSERRNFDNGKKEAGERGEKKAKPDSKRYGKVEKSARKKKPAYSGRRECWERERDRQKKSTEQTGGGVSESLIKRKSKTNYSSNGVVKADGGKDLRGTEGALKRGGRELKGRSGRGSPPLS